MLMQEVTAEMAESQDIFPASKKFGLLESVLC